MLLFLFGHISCGDDPGLAIMNGQDDQEKTAAACLAVAEITPFAATQDEGSFIFRDFLNQDGPGSCL